MKNNNLIILLTISILSFVQSSCKKKPVDTVGIPIVTSVSLNAALPEASGLEIDNNGRFWANNDRGNSAVLFGFNSSGTLERQIELTIDNEDWEDLAMDDSDNFYVGDFGNNDNDRTDLKVYLIPEFSSINSTSVTPEIIKFSFEDQTAFPPSDNQLHFDVEGFFAHNEMLYLFTKDRTDPFQGKTNLYQIPAVAGEHVATMLGSFNTFSSKKEGAITGADISPDGSKMILLSQEKIFLFTSYQAPDFFSGDVEILDISVNRKFEGIAFKNECDVYLVNEDSVGEAPQLSSIDICE